MDNTMDLLNASQKVLLYGQTGTGKSYDIINYINTHDHIMIASPCSIADQLRYGAQHLDTASEKTGMENEQLITDLREQMFGGVYHAVMFGNFANVPTAKKSETFLKYLKDKVSQGYEGTYGEGLNSSHDALIIWGGFKEALMDTDCVQILTDLPCKVFIEYTGDVQYPDPMDEYILNNFTADGIRDKWTIKKYQRPHQSVYGIPKGVEVSVPGFDIINEGNDEIVAMFEESAAM